MAFQTPRRLGPPRSAHSLSTVASQPNLSLASSTAVARKASLNALVGGPDSPGKMGGDGQEVDVGDIVDVPGGMHGTVKFVGTVRGKKGIFAGVELSSAFASRGKNDGDVDGVNYFTTSVPGSGIFLPIHRALKRSSATLSTDSFPETPTTPSYSNNFSLSTTEKPNFSPSTPSLPRFAQSVGPGARAPSPQFKPIGRPSLPRPESPYRKTPSLAPTPQRAGSVTPSGLSKSVGPGRFNSPGPRSGLFTKPRTPGPSRPYSRNTNSRLGHHDTIDEDGETTPSAHSRLGNSTMSPGKTRRPPSNPAEEEVQRLKKLLEERDQQLSERDQQLTAQAATLEEMEAGLSEIQNLMPPEARGNEPADVAQLRALLREKNDKIDMLTAEFDNHRADFRSTIDTLEMASTETERVYEGKVQEYERRIEDYERRGEELEIEIRELHERGHDVESVAEQLKQLEELVAELEEGLEDARRGEAEARGEVEFLRGEVERGRSELRREREKAAAALKGAGAMVDAPSTPGSRDLEQRDDEIRGLKAIIHSLSSGPEERGSPMPRQGSFVDPEELRIAREMAENLEREKEELRGLVERKAFREEELEREVERLKSQLQLNGVDQRESITSNGLSDHTVIHHEKPSTGRDSKATVTSWRASEQKPKHQEEHARLDPMMESDAQSSVDGSVLWCEICETGGHDILNCSAMGSGDVSAGAAKSPSTPGKRVGKEAVIEGLRNLSLSSEREHSHPAALTPGRSPGNAPSAPAPPPFNASTNKDGLVPPKGEAVADPDKWCALCESEGHDVTACPNEDAF